MDLPKEIVQLLQYLLPGFLTAWVFYALTSYPRPSQFERVIQALIFTLFIRMFLFITEAALLAAGTYVSFGEWNNQSELFFSIVWALALGVTFSFLANTDKLHKVLRKCKITRETSYPSEWFGAFLLGETYVVLHLQDERRLYGWPEEWPSSPSVGYFRIAEPSWLVGEEEKPITGVETVLISVHDVKWVEFLDDKTWRTDNGKEGTNSTTTKTATS